MVKYVDNYDLLKVNNQPLNAPATPDTKPDETDTSGSIYDESLAKSNAENVNAQEYVEEGAADVGTNLDTGTNPFIDLSATSAEELFNRLDTDGDKTLSDTELSLFSNILSGINGTMEQLKEILTGFGLSVQGADTLNITDLKDVKIEDFEKIARKSPKIWEEIEKIGVDKVFKELDKDGDGMLSEKELSEIASVDKEKGFISLDELKKVMDNAAKDTQEVKNTDTSNKTQRAAKQNWPSGGNWPKANEIPQKLTGLDTMSLEELESEQTTRESALSDKRKALSDVYSGNNDAVKSAQNEEKQAKQTYENALKNDSNISQELKEKQAKNSQDLDKNQGDIDLAKADISDKENEIFGLENSKSSIESELTSLNASLSSLPAKGDDAEKNAQIDEKKASIESQIKAKEAEQKEVEGKLTTAQNDLKTKKENLTTLEGEKTILEQEKQGIDKEIFANCNSETKAALEKYNDARGKTEEVKNGEISRIQKEITTAEDSVIEIKTKITDVKNTKTAKDNSVDGNMASALEWAKQFKGMSQSQMAEIFKQFTDSETGNSYQFDYGAWCADFVRLVVGEGADYDVPDWYKDVNNKAYCPTIQQYGENSKVSINEAKPGDIVLYDWDGDKSADHVGLFMGTSDGYNFTALEGNTSGSGGGSCVEEKSRKLSQVIGFYDMGGNAG